MSVVRFTYDRVHPDDMPHLCLRCGAKATVTQNKTFSKSQGWTTLFVFFGGIPYILAMLIFRNRFRVAVPLCDAHRNHFHWQAGILWGGLALLAALVTGCFALIGHVSDDMLTNCFIGTGIVAAIWLVVFMVNRFCGITAATVSSQDALVVGVSEKFAKAYMLSDREPLLVEPCN